MDISIVLEEQDYLVRTREDGNKIEIPLPRKTTEENPIFIDQSFDTILIIYVRKEAYLENAKEQLEKLISYLKKFSGINTISFSSKLWNSPFKEFVSSLPKHGITIKGNYVLTKEDYQLLKDTEVINVEDCNPELLNKSNLYLSRLVGYKSHWFSNRDKISDAIKTKFLKIEIPFEETMRHDLYLFFRWNRSLDSVTLSGFSPKDYLTVIKELKPFMNKIPKIFLTISIRENYVEEMKQIKELLESDAEKVEVWYQTHLCSNKLFPNSCTLSEYIVMDEILSFYQKSIQTFAYSPLEQLIYAYDIVKSTKYQEVEDENDKMQSRNLHRVVLGGEIVCVGFSNLLNALLTKLSIPATESSVALYRSPEKEEGHQRSIVYLKDEKYGIDGVFICDPTWDAISTLDLGYDTQIDRYNYFLLPYDQMQHSREPENINGVSMLSMEEEFLKTQSCYVACQSSLIEKAETLGLINVPQVLSEHKEMLEDLPYIKKDEAKRNLLYEYAKKEFLKHKQKVSFNIVAEAIQVVRREERVYSSLEELKQAVMKMIALHDKFYPMAFDDQKMSFYICQNGVNQVFVEPVSQIGKSYI